MKRVDYPEALTTLIRQLKRLPGVGPRSAERMALWVVQSRDARAVEIASAMCAVVEQIHGCSRCGFFAAGPLCDICLDETRSGDRLCVIEQPTDVLPIERTGVFDGRYHALGGRIAPLDHVGPEDLRIDDLLRRVREERPAEVILALSADVEGEATANYIAEVLRDEPVAVSRLAQGIAAGSGLESADEVTLGRAFRGRTRIP